MHIIVPMSGIGKRFLNAGYTTPKPLIEVEGKPIVQHVIELFPGNHRFTFVCNNHHLSTTKMKEILNDIVPGCNIVEVDVNNRKGPVGAVLQASVFIRDDEPTIVSYCDYGTQWSFEEFVKDCNDTDADGCIACYKGFHPHMLGTDNYAFVKENAKWMDEIREKQPFTDDRMSEYASNGTYYFKRGDMIKQYFKKLVELNQPVNGEFYVSLVYNLMKQDALRIRIFEIQKMLQWGTPKDLEEYLLWSDYFLNRHPIPSIVSTRNTTLILPMAGAGSRFFNEGYAMPKPLLDIEGTPMIIKAVECLPQTNRKIFVCQNDHLRKFDIESQIHAHFSNTSVIGIDGITQGQASTCDIAFNSQLCIDDAVLISACDNGVYYNIREYEKLMNDDDVDIIVWCFSNNPTSKLYPHMYAWVDVDTDNYIKRVSVKKPFDDCENKYAIIGTFLFKEGRFFKEGLEHIYKHDIRTNNEFYVDNMIEPLIAMGYKCKIFNVSNYLCWGTPNDYKTYNYWHEFFTKL